MRFSNSSLIIGENVSHALNVLWSWLWRDILPVFSDRDPYRIPASLIFDTGWDVEVFMTGSLFFVCSIWSSCHSTLLSYSTDPPSLSGRPHRYPTITLGLQISMLLPFSFFLLLATLVPCSSALMTPRLA